MSTNALILNNRLNSVDTWFDRLWSDALNRVNTSGSFVPAVDLYEDEANYYVQLAAPGLSKEAFNIELQDRVLRISGERKLERTENRRFHLVETSFGSFRRDFRLPQNIRREAIGANYTDGILTVTLPKDEARPLVSKVEVR